MWVGMLGSIGVLFALFKYKDSHPLNAHLLLVWTLMEAYTVGVVRARSVSTREKERARARACGVREVGLRLLHGRGAGRAHRRGARSYLCRLRRAHALHVTHHTRDSFSGARSLSLDLSLSLSLEGVRGTFACVGIAAASPRSIFPSCVRGSLRPSWS